MNKHPLLRRVGKEKEFWMISGLLLAWAAVFLYYPMYGLSIAFFRYRPGRGFINENFVGLKYFIQFITSKDFPSIMRNTLVISFLNILFGFPAPIIFALLLNEIHHLLSKKIFQTLSYIPYFISWVVVASFVFTLMGTEGLFNEVLLGIGLIDSPIQFLSNGRYFWVNITLLNIWKGIGFTAIIYLSAIAGIDSTYYDAGQVDGVGRFRAIWHITLPNIQSTIMVLFILGIGNILSAGFEQQLLIGNDLTREYHEVIDTYTYRYGLQLGKYSFATAVGLMKSIIGVTLVFSTNYLGKKIFDISII